MLLPGARVRIKNDLTEYPATSTIWGTTYGPTLVPYYRNHSEMHDYENRKVKGRYRPSPCIHIQHTVETVRQYGGPVWSSFFGYGTYTSNGSPMVFTPAHVNDTLPIVPVSLYNDLCLEAFNSFSTQIPTEVSILNFGWELREIAELMPRLTTNLLTSVSGSYLNYQFGWKPFLDDLRKLGSLLSTVNSKIKHLQDTWGKRTRLSIYRRNVIDDYYPFPSLFPILGFDSTNYGALGVSGHRADFRATGYLFHQLEGLNSTYGDIRAVITALGLGNPVKAVWDAIPFSFVAGWFTRIGRHLDKLAINPYDGQWEVSDCCYTLTERIIVTQYKVRTLGIPGDYVEAGGRVEVKRYTRQVGLPIGVDSFNLSDLNPNQLALMSALIVGQYH